MIFLFRGSITVVDISNSSSSDAFSGSPGNEPPKLGHAIPGAEEGGQLMQLAQVQLAQVVSSAVRQALTQHVPQTASNPPLAAATSTAAAQQVQSPTKLEIPAFEGDSSAIWLTWSQGLVYPGQSVWL